MDVHHIGAEAPGSAVPQSAQDLLVNRQLAHERLVARSTATEAQRARMVVMLRPAEKSTFDFRRAGVMQSATRIHELRKLGYVIHTERRDMWDAEGFRHSRVAVYALIREPESAK